MHELIIVGAGTARSGIPTQNMSFLQAPDDEWTKEQCCDRRHQCGDNLR